MKDDYQNKVLMMLLDHLIDSAEDKDVEGALKDDEEEHSEPDADNEGGPSDHDADNEDDDKKRSYK